MQLGIEGQFAPINIPLNANWHNRSSDEIKKLSYPFEMDSFLFLYFPPKPCYYFFKLCSNMA